MTDSPKSLCCGAPVLWRDDSWIGRLASEMPDMYTQVWAFNQRAVSPDYRCEECNREVTPA